MKNIILDNLINSKAFAARIALILNQNITTTNNRCIIAFNGDLGSGKTTIIREILINLGVNGLIKSPTFTYLEQYDIHQNSNPNIKNIYHFDLYRLNNYNDCLDLGFDEYLLANNAIIFIEWYQKIAESFSKIDWIIDININTQDSRIIKITPVSQFGNILLNHD